jgi:7-keto-8-aminopelargonate synthetase-like enzyme
MAGEFSHALLDERAHVALQAAARELHCPVRKFRHRDVADLALRVRECGARARPILLTDGMFGHDGSVAPVREYLAVLPRAGWLLVDDAYAAGTIGRRGQGTIEYAGVSRKRIIQCVTLSKAFGVYGGAVLGPKSLPDRIFSRSSMFIGSTPLPLPLINAALVAVGIMRRSAYMRRRLAANTARVREGIRAAGWTLPEHPGPIVALPPQSPGCTRQLTRALRAAGVFPSLLKYPGGPAAGYFRFVVSSEHTRPQLDALIAALCAVRAPAG